ncbi:MAG TPA: hypothetical protein GXX25_11975 [Desulfotomaculum sp.]|nr:hypothetical protein [Desulfotomaculum sp.]
MIKKIKWRVIFAFALSLILLTMPAAIGFAGAKAVEKTGFPDIFSLVRDGVGNSAWALGIRSYKVESVNNNEIIVEFSGTSPSLQGILRIKWDNPKKASMKLVREEGTLSVVWDGNIGELSLSDMKARSASIRFNSDTKSWVAKSDFSWSIIKENGEDVKLMGAIASDFNQARMQKLSKQQNPLIQATSICPDYSNPIKGGTFGTTKSDACYKARGYVASECSNQYCWGCYSYKSTNCDCICTPGLGDFYCYCEITGFPCKDCEY